MLNGPIFCYIEKPGRLSNGSCSPKYHGKEGAKMLFLPREEGQGLVEYALILVLVAIVVIAILVLLGPVVGNVFSNIVSSL
jgi:pilus assembly protein Flp/PilA